MSTYFLSFSVEDVLVVVQTNVHHVL